MDGGAVEIAAHLVYELDADGKRLRVVEVHRLHRREGAQHVSFRRELRAKWSKRGGAARRSSQALEERGISFEELAEAAKQPDADPFDLLCHVAYNAPLRTRRERAEMLRQREERTFSTSTDRKHGRCSTRCSTSTSSTARRSSRFRRFSKCRRFPSTATSPQIAALFGGAERMRAAVGEMQTLLYAA